MSEDTNQYHPYEGPVPDSNFVAAPLVLAMTVPEAAVAARLDLKDIYDAFRRGEMRGIRVGQKRVVLVEDFRAWLLSQSLTPASRDVRRSTLSMEHFNA